MNLRKHYKLYKSGKQWCTMAIAVIASTIAMTTAVNADTNVANVGEQEISNSTQNSNDVNLSNVNEVKLTNNNVESNETLFLLIIPQRRLIILQILFKSTQTIIKMI